MTNKNAPAGGKIIGAIQSADFNTLVNEYVIPTSDANDYFVNDFVKTINTSENGLPICVKAAASEALRGIIIGFKPDSLSEDTIYRTGGVRRIAYVCDDPFVQFTIQATGTLTETDIGKNADIVVVAGSVATGLSGTQVDTSTIATSTGQLKILRILDSPINELGEFTKVLGMIFEHELNSGAAGGVLFHNTLLNLSFDSANHGTGKTGFQRGTTNSASDPTVSNDDTEGYRAGDFWINTVTESAFVCVDPTTGAAVWHKVEHSTDDIWNRVGTTIDPANAGDTLDIGTGEILTSSITTTAIGAPISTTDGTMYYDSAANEFKFRENGAWETLAASGVWSRVGTTLEPANVGDDVDMGTGEISTSNQVVTPKIKEETTGNGIDIEFDGNSGKFYDYSGNWFSMSGSGTPDDGTNFYIPYSSSDGWYIGFGMGDAELISMGGGSTDFVLTGNGKLSINQITDTPAIVFNVVAATGITPVNNTAIPIQSSTAGDTNITAVPQIVAGSNGQRLTLIGYDDSKTVTLDNGDGLALDNGQSFTLGENDIIEFIFYNSLWIETTRKDN